MRRLMLVALLMAVLALGFGAPGPTAAQGGNTILPPLRLITAARFEQFATEGERPLVVAQGYKESRGRFYVVVRNLVTGNTTEVVLYDGKAWTRVNDAATWQPAANVGAIRNLVPTADTLLLYDGPLASLGPATIGGAATEHYQIWGDGGISDPRDDGFVKVDFYVGVQDRYLYQFVTERTLPRPDGGGLRHVTVTVRFFDHGDPTLKVTPPA